MNLREWARSTHQALANLPPDQRGKDLSAADVERVMRMGITMLIATLVAGGDLRIDDLGKIWAEQKSPRRVVCNLKGQSKTLTLRSRRVVRFHPSSRLTRTINDFSASR